MRYMLDTNIFVFFASEADRLTSDVQEILSDYDTTLCMSAESVRELIIAYRGKRLLAKHWKSETEMIRAMQDEYHIHILPVGLEHMKTLAELKINTVQGHNDPSDFVIIAHAITEKLPLISSDTRFPFYRRQGLDLIENT